MIRCGKGTVVSGGRGSRWWRSILYNDDFPEAAVTVELLDFAVIDSELMGAFTLSGTNGRCWHEGRSVSGCV